MRTLGWYQRRQNSKFNLDFNEISEILLSLIDLCSYLTPPLDTGGLGLGLFFDLRPSRYSILSQCLARVVHCLGSSNENVVEGGKRGGAGEGDGEAGGVPISFSQFVHAGVYLNR